MPLRYRYLPLSGDLAAVEEIVRSTRRFTDDEVQVARELIADALARGEGSGYCYVFACRCNEVLGFTCYGPIPGSHRRYELYWIAVQADMQGCGIGRSLLAQTERRIADRGGVRVYAETSSRADYDMTRAFYRSQGYREAAFLDGYYEDADGLVVFMKRLVGPAPQVHDTTGELAATGPAGGLPGLRPPVSRAA